MRVLERSADDRDPLRRRLRAVDRRARRRSRAAAARTTGSSTSNGVESPIGAAEYASRGGERIWWDYRDWTAAMRVPAVVGSWPRAVRRRLRGQRHPVAVECLRRRPRLRARCARRWSEPASSARPRPLRRTRSGSWSAPGRGCARTRPRRWIEAARRQAASSPASSRRRRLPLLELLDQTASRSRDLGPGAGLVAATRRYEAPPVWVVTGTDAAACAAAAGLLDAADLRDHYAVAIDGGGDAAAGADEVAVRLHAAAAAAAGGLARRGGRLPRRARRRRLPLLEPAGPAGRGGVAAALAGLLAGAGARGARRAAAGPDAGAADRRRQRPGHQPRRDRAGRGSASGRCSGRSTSPLEALVAGAVHRPAGAVVDGRLRRLLGLRRPRPRAARAAPARRPLGADRDAGLPPGPGRRRRRRAPARGGRACAAPAPRRSAGPPWPAACSPARSTAPSTSPPRSSCAVTRCPCGRACGESARGTTCLCTRPGPRWCSPPSPLASPGPAPSRPIRGSRCPREH